MEFIGKIKKIFNKTVTLVTFICLFLICVIFSDFIFLQIDHAKAFYHVNNGDKEYKSGDYQQAINSYNEALTLYPEHVKARYNLGNIYVVYEDYNGAVDCYTEALKYNPYFINARVNLGIILAQELLDFDNAIEQYKKAIEAKPILIDIPFIFNNKKNVLSNKEIANYNMGLAYKSKSLLYGSDEDVSRQYLKNSVESYKKAIEIDDTNYESHYNLALTYHLLGEHNNSLKQYCRAINIDPMSYEAHYNLGILLSALKRYLESMEEIEKAALILNNGIGQGYKTKYIFDVLMDITGRAMLSHEEGKVLKIKAEKSQSVQADIMKSCQSCVMIGE